MKKLGWILALLFVPFVALAGTEDVFALANSGVSTEVMIAFVERSESSFDLTADDIKRLRDCKVPDAVIVKMLRHRGAPENVIVTRNGVIAREQRLVTRERVVEAPERTVVYNTPSVVYASPSYVSPVVYASSGYYSYPRYYSSYCAPRYYGGYYGRYCAPRYGGYYGGGYCAPRSGFSIGFRGRF